MPYRYEDENGNPTSYYDEMRHYIIRSRHSWVSDENLAMLVMGTPALEEVTT